MSCCQPFTLYNPKWYNGSNPYMETRFPLGIQVPCGYCLNCRVDRRNMWSDRAKWELKHRLCGAFVTITYSDIWITELLRVSPTDGKLRATLDYKHARKFVNRIRSHVKYHKELQNVLCQPDFSYILVGEYGERGQVFDRPHFHILFFGLDFAYMKKIFRQKWPFGWIDVLPILDGGINYVLKYMDKQLFGDFAKLKYDAHFIARPKMITSMSFGRDLFLNQKEDIQSYDFTYKAGKVRRPVPMYYLKKMFGRDFSVYNNALYAQKLQNNAACVKVKMSSVYRLKDLSYKGRQNFVLYQARLRERKLRQKILDQGVGVFDYTMPIPNPVKMDYDHKRVKSLAPSVQQWLANDYIKYLEKEFFNAG